VGLCAKAGVSVEVRLAAQRRPRMHGGAGRGTARYLPLPDRLLDAIPPRAAALIEYAS